MMILRKKMKRFTYLFVPLFVFALILGFFFVFPKINQIQASKSPITGIDVQNKRVYRKNQMIKVSDFTVNYIHENGKKSPVDEKDISISRKYPQKTGKTTKIQVTCKAGKKSFSKTIEVLNQRNEIVRFHCGYPDLKSVDAVLYSNGELSFEGEGDVRQFTEYPWKEYETEDVEITAITFEDSVTPKNMDGWFSDMDTLTYVDEIPPSVESIVSLFENDINLVKAPDLTQCKSLLNATAAYRGCSSLTAISNFPESIRVADYMCTDAENLKEVPDLSGAVNLTQAVGMFSGCHSLTLASLPPSLVNGEEMFTDCINLKEMPETPETMQNMAKMYQGDMLLSKVSNIPVSCTDYSSCFSGCSSIQGTLKIDSNTETWGGFLDAAAAATDLDLSGASTQLTAIGQEYMYNMRLTINGQNPQSVQETTQSEIAIETKKETKKEKKKETTKKSKSSKQKK